jgi:pyruvate,water dikinase
LSDPTDITMLLSSELDDYVAHPSTMAAVIAERLAGYRSLFELEPPYIISKGVPPLSQWRKRADHDHRAAVRPGMVLTGGAGGSGRHTGTVRVVRDPADPSALEPGNVLVAPLTDPAWTPLFLVAGAVIVDVGAMNSHAIVVCRELDIPCVVSVTGATDRLPDGAIVTVDGTAGTVTVDELPVAGRTL